MEWDEKQKGGLKNGCDKACTIFHPIFLVKFFFSVTVLEYCAI